ncbi:MAG: DNA polymerase III subunit delta' [Alphaproteobacteria bacterium]
MSPDEELLRRPALAPKLVGHQTAAASVRAAIDAGKMAHAWLICGPRGIGKATLAYHIARTLLSPPAERGGGVNLAPDSPTFRRVAAGGHGDLRVLTLEHDDKRKRMRTEIRVEQVRALGNFFAMTSAEGGWRVAIIDSMDQLNANAANALLKILEEPPERTVLLLVSHAPGRLLPTIRSRCRRLNLRPLTDDEVAEVLRQQADMVVPADAAVLSRLADGSPGLALELAEAGGVDVYGKLVQLLSDLPRVDYAQVHTLADRLARRGAEADYRLWTALVPVWLTRLVRAGVAAEAPAEAAAGEAALARRLAAGNLDRWVDVWEKITQLVARTDAVNMDRKQAVLAIFLALEQAARA